MAEIYKNSLWKEFGNRSLKVYFTDNVDFEFLFVMTDICISVKCSDVKSFYYSELYALKTFPSFYQEDLQSFTSILLLYIDTCLYLRAAQYNHSLSLNPPGVKCFARPCLTVEL